jgi:protein Tex
VQRLVAEAIAEHQLDIKYTVVDEDGASVYSASDVAREEFPELDLTIRGAISIGRRLQDPLAELVKIDAKSIGVGLYQHDVNQKRLSESVDEVVESVVNRVGVNINTASHSLLKYVSGINGSLAKKIVKFRDDNGVITSRDELKKVSGMGEKTFEQCAGFLKIPESANPLDNSWVHPERYALASEILPLVKAGNDPSREQRAGLKEKYGVGDTTIDDILLELKKPNRDPRDELPKPILSQGRTGLRGPERGHEGDRQGEERRGLRRLRRHRHQGKRSYPRVRALRPLRHRPHGSDQGGRRARVPHHQPGPRA